MTNDGAGQGCPCRLSQPSPTPVSTLGSRDTPGMRRSWVGTMVDGSLPAHVMPPFVPGCWRGGRDAMVESDINNEASPLDRTGCF